MTNGSGGRGMRGGGGGGGVRLPEKERKGGEWGLGGGNEFGSGFQGRETDKTKARTRSSPRGRPQLAPEAVHSILDLFFSLLPCAGHEYFVEMDLTGERIYSYGRIYLTFLGNSRNSAEIEFTRYVPN